MCAPRLSLCGDVTESVRLPDVVTVQPSQLCLRSTLYKMSPIANPHSHSHSLRACARILVVGMLVFQIALIITCSCIDARVPPRVRLVDDGPAIRQTRTHMDPPVFDVTRYGAVGDNVTDCTGAVGKAAQALSSSPDGGVLYFPSGVYRFTSKPIEVAIIELWTAHPNNPQFIIQGENSATTILSWDPSLAALFYVASADPRVPMQFTLHHLSIQLLNVPNIQPAPPTFVPITSSYTNNSLLKDIIFFGPTNAEVTSLGLISYATALSIHGLSVVNFTTAARFSPPPLDTGISFLNVDGLSMSDVTVDDSTLHNGFLVLNSTDVSIMDMRVRATIADGAIILANTTQARIENIALTSPVIGHGSSYLQNGIVVQDACDDISIQTLITNTVHTGVLISSMNVSSQTNTTSKTIQISGCAFQDTDVGINIVDHSTVDVTDSTFTQSLDIWSAGFNGIRRKDSTGDMPKYIGDTLGVQNCRFVGLGGGGLDLNTGYTTIQDSLFHDLNIGLMYQPMRLSEDPIPTLQVLKNQFQNVNQYVMFITGGENWIIQDNTCTVTTKGTINSDALCIGSDQHCIMQNNQGCKFNSEP